MSCPTLSSARRRPPRRALQHLLPGQPAGALDPRRLQRSGAGDAAAPAASAQPRDVGDVGDAREDPRGRLDAALRDRAAARRDDLRARGQPGGVLGDERVGVQLADPVVDAGEAARAAFPREVALDVGLAGPQPAARIAQPDGRERRPHGRGVMPVVVEHDDPADLALDLEPAADAIERARPARIARRRPRRRAHRRPPSARRRHCAARAAASDPVRAWPGPRRPRTSRSVPSPSSPRRSRRWWRAARRPRRRPALDADPPPRPPARASITRRTPRSPTLATSVGGSPVGAPLRPIQPSNAATTAASSANTSGWSHSALIRTAMAGRYGSKLPAYSSASTTKSRLRPIRATPRCGPAIAAGSMRADEPGRVRAGPDEHVEQPAGRRRLAVRAGDRDQAPPAGRGRVGDDLLDALGRDARARARPRARGGRDRPT